jgi:hypothetical protein
MCEPSRERKCAGAGCMFANGVCVCVCVCVCKCGKGVWWDLAGSEWGWTVKGERVYPTRMVTRDSPAGELEGFLWAVGIGQQVLVCTVVELKVLCHCAISLVHVALPNRWMIAASERGGGWEVCGGGEAQGTS